MDDHDQQRDDRGTDPFTGLWDRLPTAAKAAAAVVVAVVAVVAFWPSPPTAPDDQPADDGPVALDVPSSTPSDEPGEVPGEDVPADGDDPPLDGLPDSDEGGHSDPDGEVLGDPESGEYIVAPDGGRQYRLPDGFPTHRIVAFPADLLTYTSDMSWVDQWNNASDHASQRLWAELQAEFEAEAGRYEFFQQVRADNNQSAEVSYLSAVTDYGPDDTGRWEIVIAYRTVATLNDNPPIESVDTMRTWWVAEDGTWKIDEVEFIPRSTGPTIDDGSGGGSGTAET